MILPHLVTKLSGTEFYIVNVLKLNWSNFTFQINKDYRVRGPCITCKSSMFPLIKNNTVLAEERFTGRLRVLFLRSHDFEKLQKPFPTLHQNYRVGRKSSDEIKNANAETPPFPKKT